MIYRIQIQTQDGLEVGRQDRELDLDLFTQIVQGQRPVGDTDAQDRDNQRHGGQDRVCVYSAIYNPENDTWNTNLAADAVSGAYEAWGRTGFGG